MMGLPMATNVEKPSLSETKEKPATNVATSAGGETQTQGTQTKTQQELDAERRYEEAIEEEYAKREGGA
jgi:hypothetical protein